MPFTRGNSGRPPGATNKVPSVVKNVWQKLGGPDGKVYAVEVHKLATSPTADPHVKLKALALLAPYVWGKPVERHEVTGAEGGPLQTIVNHIHQA